MRQEVVAALLEKILRVGTELCRGSLWEKPPDRGILAGITAAGAGDGKPRTGRARVSVSEGRRWTRQLSDFAPRSMLHLKIQNFKRFLITSNL